MTKHNKNVENKEEIDRLNSWLMGCERITKFMAFLFVGLSAWLTTKGLFDAKIEAHAANTEGMVTAAMTAIVAAIMIGGANMLLFGLATHASKKQRWQVIGLTAAIIPFVGAISTYNAVLATSLEKATVLALRDRGVELTEYVEYSTQDAMNAQVAKVALLPQQSSLCLLADAESQNGLLTGSGGAGAVSAAYASACSSVQTIIETLDETVSATDVRRNQANDILAQMEDIPRNTAITVFERQEQFKAQDRLLRKLMQESSAERVAERIAGQLKNLENSVATLGVKKGAFGDQQIQDVANLKTSLQSISSTVNPLLSQSGNAAQKPGAMLTSDQVLVKYWKNNISTIAIAVATDTFALWIIAFLFVARSMVNDRIRELTASENTNTSPIEGRI